MLVGVSVAMLGIGFPTYAGGLPIVGDIFRFLDNGRTGLYENYKADVEKPAELHNNYKQYAIVLNMIKESNGIKITVNDVIFDGKTVSINYSIESNRDLGKNPSTLEFLTIKGAGSQSGSNE
ncbi:anti-sigma factor, partial [Bacillus thuringiensis]